MKKNRIYCMAMALAMLGGACSSDTLDPGSDNGGNGVSPDDGVYVSVNFTMPTASKGTRSFTDGDNSSNNGVEIGKDYENAVGNVVIVLAKEDNSFIASATVMDGKLEQIGTSPNNMGIYRSTSVFSKTEMNAYYNSEKFSRDINVFVFCNPVKELTDVLDNASLGNTTWYNSVGTYIAKTGTSDDMCIWGSNKFLMSNSAIAKRTLPVDMNDWNYYSTEANPFNLSGVNNVSGPNPVDNYNDGRGNIKVERTAARFDFRDGALDGMKENADKELYNGVAPQTYEVVFDSRKNALVNIKLGKMALVNMNNKYYFLKRVSSNGLDDNAIVCGPEMPWYTDATGTPIAGGTGNYVVDAYAKWKNETNLNNVSATSTVKFGDYLNYPFFNNDGTIDNTNVSNDRWATSLIKDVLEGDDDNNQTWDSGNSLGDYKIWRYAIESTIPGIERQKYAISTGVVFKGQMLPAREANNDDDEFTKKLLDAVKIRSNEQVKADYPEIVDYNSYTAPIIYQFAGKLYVTWENIKKAAIAEAITDLKWNEEGKVFTYNIDRSNPLYVAVFGTGGFGEVFFNYNETDKNGNIVSTGTDKIVDDKDADVNCANNKWDAWNKTGKKDNVPELGEFRKAATDANISIYQASFDESLGGWGYYCYYYYWNRHNNNGQDGIMGPMEFAVVRNNVYKLAVTKISRLGHPRISANDPDKPTPDTDDEQSNVYITVQCEAMPWVVRLNDIEF